MGVMLFPYNQGVTQYRVPLTWQIVSITGIYGATYLVLLVNAVAAEALYRHREGRPFPWLPTGLALSALAGVMAFGRWRFDAVEARLREADVVRVAQLQSPTGMVERMQGTAREAFDEWVTLTATLEPGSADVVIWPEGACPYDLNRVEGRSNRSADVVASIADRVDGHLLVGGGTREREVDPTMGETHVEVFNSVYLFDADGTELGRYDKVVPLPFGEYLPFGDYVPWLSDLIGGIGDFRAGDEAVVFEVDGLRMATPICYEAILPSVCRWFEQPNLFVNVTNDAWFGDTAAPHQHAMLAAIRSTELGVPLVRSGYTGVSFVVEPHGVIHSETEPFTRVHRVVGVRHATVPTLYARFGDWFVALCAAGLAGGWLAGSRRRGEG
jgi:apolipoprotein N-acyltransferase